MKKFLLAALLMSGMATFAQEVTKTTTATAVQKEKPTPASKAKKLATDLELNEKQEAKVTELLTEQEKTKAVLKEKRKAATDETAKAALKEETKQENIAFKAKMKEVLTEEQYRKWQVSRRPANMKKFDVKAADAKALNVE